MLYASSHLERWFKVFFFVGALRVFLTMITEIAEVEATVKAVAIDAAGRVNTE